jgi:hypothetical protein
MGKSIFDAGVIDELMDRVSGLAAEDRAKWGKMNPTEMLSHCNKAIHKTLSWDRKLRKATFKQHMVKWMALYIFPRFPKNVKTSSAFETHGNVSNLEFENQKSMYKELLLKLQHLDKSLSAPHPYFGPLTHQEWGLVIWKHLDHHLKQFGH